LISAALGGCSGGDFGRTRQDFRNDDMHRWLGAEVTSSVGLAPSQFQLTEGERQLRDLAYPLIEPPHSRPAWKSVFGDYQPLPSPWRQRVVFDRTMYGRALIDEPHRSHASRYSQLIDDVRNDIARFEPFFASAQRVIELDRRRSASLRMVSELSPPERADAVARMEENTLIVQWVQQCLERRISSYRWALERLVIHAPDNIAADADRLIGELAAQTANPPVAAQPPVIGRHGGEGLALAPGRRLGADLLFSSVSKRRDEVLQRVRRQSRRTVGEPDLTLHIDLDLADGDLGIGARHALGNDGDADAGGNQRHCPIFGFGDRCRLARRGVPEEFVLFAMTAVDHRHAGEVGGAKPVFQR
jgi:hypothetical protein